MELKERIASVLRKECGLNPAKPIVIGVSGGPDSVTLFHALYQLGWKTIIAHFNHHLRRESDFEAQFVEKMANEYKVEYFVGEADINSLAQKEKKSIEEIARYERYAFLFKIAKENKAAAVLVGHNANDQAETILMHIIRGSGMRGLTGMRYKTFTSFDSEIPLIRPMLDIPRSEIEKYCAKHHLNPVYDHSNKDTKYFRNKIRHYLIPELEKINPQIIQHLNNLAEILKEELKILDKIFLDKYGSHLVEKKEKALIFNKNTFKQEDTASQRGILRIALKKLNDNPGDIDFYLVEKIREVLQTEKLKSQLRLKSNLHLSIQNSHFILSKNGFEQPIIQWPQWKLCEPKRIKIQKEYQLDNQWSLKYEEVIRPTINFSSQSEKYFCVLLDVKTDIQQMKVCNFHPGLRYRPFGMNGHSIKVSDFWINKKVPREARKDYPLIYIDDQLAWIPGFQPSHDFRITEKTQKCIRIALTNHNRSMAESIGQVSPI